MSNQAKIIFISFIYFAEVLNMNETPSKKLMKLFRKLAKLTKMYEHKLEEIINDLNTILKDVKVNVDYLLLSVTIIAEYYEQTKGMKRLFYPMSWDKILELQDECLQLDDKYADNTFKVAEKIVKELLK